MICVGGEEVREVCGDMNVVQWYDYAGSTPYVDMLKYSVLLDRHGFWNSKQIVMGKDVARCLKGHPITIAYHKERISPLVYIFEQLGYMVRTDGEINGHVHPFHS